MKDLRITGTIDNDNIDITLRTDLVNEDSENFNITQIQEGPDFSTSDINNPIFQKYFGAKVKLVNSSLSELKSIVQGYSLSLEMREANGNGGWTTLI